VSAYDHVVVGGGSAGCIAAAELARHARVLLLEGGPAAEEHPETLTAAGYKEAFVNDAVMGERFTVKQAGAAGQRVYAGTGTVMGGSSSVNGMVYTRGARLDYEEWPVGWRWDDLQDDFRALEDKQPDGESRDEAVGAAGRQVAVTGLQHGEQQAAEQAGDEAQAEQAFDPVAPGQVQGAHCFVAQMVGGARRNTCRPHSTLPLSSICR
jgi:choline dehydrogenase-like flavoprotein